MSDYADRKPWLDLPNPFGFMPLYEQINHIHQAPPAGSAAATGAKNPRRTARVGRDWLGVGFHRGDLVLGTVNGHNEYLEVDEIFLDDSKGMPYSSRTNLVLQKSTARVFNVSRRQGPNRPWPLTLQAVEMSWIGNHLGLIGSDASKELGKDFIALSLQTFRVRAKAVVIPGQPDGAKRSLRRNHLTAFSEGAERSLIELRLECEHIPLIGDPQIHNPQI